MTYYRDYFIRTSIRLIIGEYYTRGISNMYTIMFIYIFKTN